MGKPEIHIITMPLLLIIFLQKYNFDLTAVVTATLIEDLIDVGKAKIHDTSGEIDLSEVYKTLMSTRIIVDHNTSYEIAYMAEIVADDILSQLVLNNIHSKLYYVVKVSPQAIYLRTYDDHMHSPLHKDLSNAYRL